MVLPMMIHDGSGTVGHAKCTVLWTTHVDCRCHPPLHTHVWKGRPCMCIACFLTLHGLDWCTFCIGNTVLRNDLAPKWGCPYVQAGVVTDSLA